MKRCGGRWKAYFKRFGDAFRRAASAGKRASQRSRTRFALAYWETKLNGAAKRCEARLKRFQRRFEACLKRCEARLTCFEALPDTLQDPATSWKDRGPAEMDVCSSPPTSGFFSETLSSQGAIREHPGSRPPDRAREPADVRGLRVRGSLTHAV